MKIILSTLLFSSLAFCELPPPYPHRVFRPSPQFSLGSHPSKHYGPSKLQSNNIDANIPLKLTIEELIQLTERLQNKYHQANRLTTLQSSYLPPPKPQQNLYKYPYNVEMTRSQLSPPLVSNFDPKRLQTSYGTPVTSQQLFRPVSRPQNQYSSSQLSGLIPASNYEVPNKANGIGYPQNTPEIQSSKPSSFGSNNPFNFHTPPATSYGVPDLKSLEIFGDLPSHPQNIGIKELRLPNKKISAFRSSPLHINEDRNNVVSQGFNQAKNQSIKGENNLGQKRPQSIFDNAKSSITGDLSQNSGSGSLNVGFQLENTKFVNNEQNRAIEAGSVNNLGLYLPPLTTPKPMTDASTIKPKTVTPSIPEGPTNFDYDYDIQQTTEASSDEITGPNISISNAVSGGGRFFYLQQPDGRLQKVILQKSQESNSRPEEYVANYYFHNIQAIPAVTYAPLISLGTWK